ncbi:MULTISPECIES: cytochrome o ubiquinol oxidase subunit IV [Erwinia]|jgi:cytochrome o ubiquinol oxidase operon protein cyoD|uniref:Cytochrome bo(3) ubiquinol oxidase subunit 4 n=1 Tax=Erwinia billingiae (strain Eb661) TaxID=634500 RepID=D8MNX4_ERWBE|nr:MULTISPECIES: cytochrome o ubiquinol oxidase subunit IV [Erwinia]MBN7121229.1 cytochrome o ubiquinol oxidase subunit IV [Erwinia billingiae]MCX0499499.1 cytochrome o ubiquinol oxidase subunit IV [Erwinia billingiae]PRB61394.1 cytochrome o ubiquinol oxidase subunit IV [Erwinia billingiae]QBR50735.1 cytochrome o ubiquinol oxidase subunit IV [Erwinia sp. QL-Z3]QEW33320.1 cytochrome o ubiquinol oxidase subunit IV [Erwinia billingiae]
MSHSTNEHGASHGSVKSYMIGFILSIILTAIPFWMVMDGGASKATILGVVIVCAIVQVLVHLVYFLHLNTSSEERWNLVAIVFSAIIILIVVVGSLWIMWNLNYNMMAN